MRIGIDFDNTIVCYDEVFPTIALERNLVPSTISRTKDAVRDYLRSIDREDEWTLLQGYVYGARMEDAQPFPGLETFLRCCKQLGHEVMIVSHKTRRPYLGEPYDLHGAARQWIADRREVAAVVPIDRIYFELTKDAKLARIGALNCAVFIDDLPEFLAESSFPAHVHPVLFDPNEQHGITPERDRIVGWADAASRLEQWAVRYGK